MRVDTSLLQGIAASTQANATALKSTGTTTSFSSALKSAAAKETTKPVPGQNYAEILTGSRAGMYVNTGGGPRAGEAFVLVKGDNGTEQHIYGTGKDRKVVTVKSSSGTSDSADATSSSEEERTSPVAGRPYADILNGPRKDLYLNTSGNARDGQTFVLVVRGEKEYHVYGTGKDRQVFMVKAKPAADTSTSTDTSSPDTTSGTATPTGPLVTDGTSS
ncbi:MAG TPA: hypothetical protein VNS09_27280 [Solirubrobacter sp.]|nr:hypothetical protein [Solirubrobacter sp.]